jgi:hypothetical protein
MTIKRISKACGSPCGTVNLSHLVGGVDLENGKYILSMHDSFDFDTVQDAKAKLKRFTLGKAKANVYLIGLAGAVGIKVESSDNQDFIDLYEAVCDHLDIEHEELPRPKHRLEDLSFVRSLRNDLQVLRRNIASRLRFGRKAPN